VSVKNKGEEKSDCHKESDYLSVRVKKTVLGFYFLFLFKVD